MILNFNQLVNRLSYNDIVSNLHDPQTLHLATEFMGICPLLSFIDNNVLQALGNIIIGYYDLE